MQITTENYGQHANRLNYLLSLDTRLGSDLEIEAMTIARKLEDFELARKDDPFFVPEF